MEATNNGSFATLVNPADTRDLAKKIKIAYKSQNLKAEKAKARIAKGFIKKTYTFENQAKVLAKFYEELLIK
jgi:glycosyltransferase involved in cell wall biosynthesis